MVTTDYYFLHIYYSLTWFSLGLGIYLPFYLYSVLFCSLLEDTRFETFCIIFPSLFTSFYHRYLLGHLLYIIIYQKQGG